LISILCLIPLCSNPLLLDRFYTYKYRETRLRI
jgi:hypothetical protein